MQETLPAGQVFIREKWLWEAAAVVVVLGPVAFVLLWFSGHPATTAWVLLHLCHCSPAWGCSLPPDVRFWTEAAA